MQSPSRAPDVVSLDQSAAFPRISLQMRNAALEAQVKTAVVEAFLETGKSLDANEIATRLDWSVSKVRRIMADAHGCVDGLVVTEEHRPSYSRNYASMQSGSHKVWVYEPTLATLRAMINELRKAANPPA